MARKKETLPRNKGGGRKPNAAKLFEPDISNRLTPIQRNIMMLDIMKTTVQSVVIHEKDIREDSVYAQDLWAGILGFLDVCSLLTNIMTAHEAGQRYRDTAAREERREQAKYTKYPPKNT